jgi:hypothetical protein
MTMGTETSGKKSLKTYGDAFDVTMLQSDVLIVNEKFAVFGKDFETSLRKQLLGYEEKEQKVKETFGPAKPLGAREVASLLTKEETTADSWQPIKTMAAQIAKLLKKP